MPLARDQKRIPRTERIHAALTAQAVGGIGNVLQLIEHKAWNQQGSRQEARLGDIRHTPIYDHAGVQ